LPATHFNELRSNDPETCAPDPRRKLKHHSPAPPSSPLTLCSTRLSNKLSVARAASLPVERELRREGEAPAEPQTLPATHFNELRSNDPETCAPDPRGKLKHHSPAPPPSSPETLCWEGEAPAEPRTLPATHFNEPRSGPTLGATPPGSRANVQ
jgi:hypothetical protein